MASRKNSLWPIVSVVAGLLVLVIALPDSFKGTWAPSFLRPGFHLGLDLAGGTQLDFRISENEIQEQMRAIDAEITALEANDGSVERLAQLRNEKLIIQEQQQNLVEAIRTVLERRINALGVSEATITPSYIGNEKHLLVECPGVVDVQECIATVGKTIQLEFKEEFTEATEEYEGSVRAKAEATLAAMRGSGITLATIGQDLGDDLGMGYQDAAWFFLDQLPKGLESVLDKTPSDGVMRLEGAVRVSTQNAAGEVVEEDVPGIFLVEVLQPKTMTGRLVQEAPVAFGILAGNNPDATTRYEDNVVVDSLAVRTAGSLRAMRAGELKVVGQDDGSADILFLRRFVPGREEADVSHILVAYKGANAAPANVTRTKEEALAKARSLKQQLTNGANFEQLARNNSDGPSAQNAGKLGPIARGQLVPSFEQVAFTQAPGIISDPVETPFGYHLIRVDKAVNRTPDRASFDVLTVTGENALDRATGMLNQMQSGQISREEAAVQVRTLFFSLMPTGWKDTQLDGKHFRAASVTLDPTTNLPVVQIIFDEEGGKLFQELTKRNIGKPIAIFVGGELVSAPMVQTEISGGTAVITGSQNLAEARLLAQDLNTGAIPAPIYLAGQRTVEASLGDDALRNSVLAGLAGIVVVMLYMFLVYRFLGLIANLALLIYAFLFIAILKLPLFLVTDSYIVLTLAGAAGLILSIGMAVDTNVLVFERVKEELKRGKSLKTAVDIGFDKAWPSIRDSNISTIITCALLFMIGTSIVRGFAITLGMGVLISMFTGMIISRWITKQIAGTSIANKPWLFPGATENSGN